MPQELATLANQSPPIATPSSIHQKTSSSGSSAFEGTTVAQSETTVPLPSAKRSLDQEFAKESKHQKTA